MKTKRLFIFLFSWLIIIFNGNKVAAQNDSIMFGRASFYANKFIGRTTSNGEIFSQEKLTAAHKTLPFGTYVKVTNLKNRHSVIVKVNDRLPQNSKRTIDLTRAAAKELHMINSGLAKVSLEIVDGR